MDRGPPVSTSAVLHLKHVNVNLHAPDNRKSINQDGGVETPKFWFRYFTKDEWILRVTYCATNLFQMSFPTKVH